MDAVSEMRAVAHGKSVAQLAKEKETDELDTYIKANISPAKVEYWLHSNLKRKKKRVQNHKNRQAKAAAERDKQKRRKQAYKDGRRENQYVEDAVNSRTRQTTLVPADSTSSDNTMQLLPQPPPARTNRPTTNDSESSDSEDDLPYNQDTGNHNEPPKLTNNTDDNQLPTDARLRPNTHEPVLTGTFKPFTKGMGNAKKRTALVIGKTANQAIGMLVPWGKQRLNVSYTRSRMQQDIGSGLLRWARPSTPNPPMGGGGGSAGGGGGGGSAGGATNPSVRTPD